MTLKTKYRKKLVELLKKSNKFETVYVKFGAELDLNKINIKDSDKATIVIAFAGGAISSIENKQNYDDGYYDANAVYFYILARNNYLQEEDDFLNTSEAVEIAQDNLIKIVTYNLKKNNLDTEFPFLFGQYQYLFPEGAEENNMTVLVQEAAHMIQSYAEDTTESFT